MFMSVKNLRRVPILAKDGNIGFHEQVFFDDEKWVIRYLVVDTGKHLDGRRVLVSPIAVDALDLESNSLRIRMTREQVRRAPDIDTDQPVSRQKELEYNRYYGYAMYWRGAGLWGSAAVPGPLLTMPGGGGPAAGEDAGDPHLRSSREVIGYRVKAKDGRVGRVEDFIFDLGDWSISYFVVGSRSWFRRTRVLVDPRWADHVDWAERDVQVNLPAKAIKSAPPFDSVADVTPEYAMRLDGHYGFTPRG